MFAHIADEVEKAEVLHPVVVVYKFGCVGGIGVEVKKAGKLLFDCLLIMAQSFFVEEFALLRFHGRVANHAGSAADKGNGLVSGTLKVFEHHHAHKVTDMKRVGGGVDAEVCGSHSGGKLLFGTGHHGMYHTAPGEFFDKVHFYNVRC